jgi:hypothetical protein
MRTIKSFEMFIGESVTNNDLQNKPINYINEAEVVPGVQLNPGTYDFSKLKNNFYVRLDEDEVQLVGLQKDSKAGEEQQISLTFVKNPIELPDGNVKGKISAFMSLQPLAKTGKEGATKYLNPYIVKSDGPEKLSASATASNLLGGFLFSSGTNISDSSFENVLKAIIRLKRETSKYPSAETNGAFKSFMGGLVDAANKRDAFKNMKESGLSSALAKRGGENFTKAFQAAIEDYKKSQDQG